MNKILMRLCLPLALTAALTACGNDDASSSDPGANVVVAPSTEPTEPTEPTESAPAAPAPAATAGSDSGSGGGEVSEADARATALAAAGAGATVREVERDDEDGRQVYKFDIAVGSTERKISVDRATGQIVKDETDRQRHGHRQRHDTTPTPTPTTEPGAQGRSARPRGHDQGSKSA
jgi:hypothetical protein